MTQSLTEWLQESRLMVVEVERAAGLVRVKDAAEQCSALTCGEHTLVVADDSGEGGLDTLGPGDIVRVEGEPASVRRIVVVRRSWEEITSPEF